MESMQTLTALKAMTAATASVSSKKKKKRRLNSTKMLELITIIITTITVKCMAFFCCCQWCEWFWVRKTRVSEWVCVCMCVECWAYDWNENHWHVSFFKDITSNVRRRSFFAILFESILRLKYLPLFFHVVVVRL